MIELSKLNGAPFLVNPDLIRFIEETPDTVLTFMDGERMVVRDRAREVVDKIVNFRRLCHPTQSSTRSVLEIVKE